MVKTPEDTVKIGKIEIDVPTVLAWIKEQGRYVTSVELRDKFGWPMRETARRLMRQLAEQNMIVIKPNPKRKRTYIYGLPSFPESKPKEKPKEKDEQQKPEEQPKKSDKQKQAAIKTERKPQPDPSNPWRTL